MWPRAKDHLIASLEAQLVAERNRVTDLLDRLLQAVPEPRTPPTWAWPHIQPEAEALEDIRGMEAEGRLSAEEAEHILEHLGFAHTEVVDYGSE